MVADHGGGRRPARRPALPGFLPEALSVAGPDPAAQAEEAEASAQSSARALVTAARTGEVPVENLVRLADEVGLDELATLWAGAETCTLPGALWALFLIQAWCHRAPLEVARLASAGRPHAEVSATIAGLPGDASREEVVRMADDLLRGALSRDLPTSFERAAALCRLLAAGRGAVPPGAREDAWAQPVLGARLLGTADGLDAAAAAERRADPS